MSGGFTWPSLGFGAEVVETFFAVLLFKQILHDETSARQLRTTRLKSRQRLQAEQELLVEQS